MAIANTSINENNFHVDDGRGMADGLCVLIPFQKAGGRSLFFLERSLFGPRSSFLACRVRMRVFSLINRKLLLTTNSIDEVERIVYSGVPGINFNSVCCNKVSAVIFKVLFVVPIICLDCGFWLSGQKDLNGPTMYRRS